MANLDFQDLIKRIDHVIELLERIEERQIKTTEMVEEVKEVEAQPTGGFASTDFGAKP